MNLIKAWWRTKFGRVPCDGAGIDAYSDASPMEQRVLRLEKGRDEDYQFIMDVLENHQERIQMLEGE